MQGQNVGGCRGVMSSNAQTTCFSTVSTGIGALARINVDSDGPAVEISTASKGQIPACQKAESMLFLVNALS